MSFRAYAIAASLFLACPLLDATIIDLTQANTPAKTGTGIGGTTFIVSQTQQQSTGTGVIDSFVRLDNTGNNNNEGGYNTDAKPVPLDDLSGTFTHSLLLANIPIVTIGTTTYREFLLDINQTNSNPLLSLNQIQIFQSNSDPGATGFTLTVASGTPTSGTDAVISFNDPNISQIFQLNAANSNDPVRNEIELNYSLNSGSGAGDMFLYVPDSYFNTSLSNVILFSQFGSPRGTYSTNDGFEEWAVMTPGTTSTVPEPGSVVLLATLLGGVAWQKFRRRAA